MTAQADPAIGAPEAELHPGPAIGESRWPPVIALLCFLALNIAVRLWIPSGSPIRVPWLVPAVEALLLVALVASDHKYVTRGGWLHPVCLGLVIMLVAAALWATVLLLHDLIDGSALSNSPTKLLAAGGQTWVGNNIAFAFLYWLMDSGGPIARARGARPVDFGYPQQLSPEIAPAGWRPVFLDYLHLGFTNATAFSPTDVVPLTRRAKYMMLLQSTVALALFGLVVARAVNAFK